MNYSKRNNDFGNTLVMGLALLIIIGVFIYMAIDFNIETKPKFKPKPLTESQIEHMDGLTCIDTTKSEFSIDNHQLVQYKSDAIIHLSTCLECLRRHR